VLPEYSDVLIMIIIVEGSIQEILNPFCNHNAAYNSAERQSEEASICLEGTRTRVLKKIERWVRGDGLPTIWLTGPAGSGKSTIAHTVAKQCDENSPRNLAFSYFFSR
jgi:pantothenate kinase-related protein Tda10